MRLTLKAVNDALAARGESARLIKGDGRFYFDSGDAANWIDKTVAAKTLSSLTLEQWLAEFERLRKLNRDILAGKGATTGTKTKEPQTGRSRK